MLMGIHQEEVKSLVQNHIRAMMSINQNILLMLIIKTIKIKTSFKIKPILAFKKFAYLNKN